MTRLESVLLAAFSLLALVTVGATLQHELGLVGLTAAEALTVWLPAFVWARGRRVPLGYAPAPLRGIAAGALLGFGAFYAMAMLEQGVIERFLPTPPEVRASIERLIAAGSWPLDLVALAIAPAVAEETLFRGAVFGAWRGRPWLAVILSAILFGAYHTSVYRMLPATVLGLALGGVRLAGGTLWAAIAFHAVNNAAVVALARMGRETLPPSVLLAALASAATAAGLGLIRVERQSQRV